ncbi:raftlin isoform X1 [Equus przewalskii]|uniref:Raftlin, lipid raft linker 1 n=2 Tax=Equus TaxID=9789 RepID=F7BMG0_HORSE|nr:raftlin isoform X2 [Equus caballus]XP_008512434.1 PREDICTED: raftlin isoform X1 [Equus przewalskii]XP_023476659.1 raftlin isoform X2 [Equus caballus]
MGCGLNKLEKRDDKRPGNIYSTLKRPQVETKIDVAYEYRFLEFTTLSTAELPRSSAVRLASLRDLPAQLLELYQQGFSLVALHPFVQPIHEQEKTPLEHIFRAILIKKTDRSQKADPHNEGYILELDCCSSLDHLTDQKIIPEFIKKIQEAASRGLKFVGVIPQHRGPVNSAGSSPPGEARDAKKEPGGCGEKESPGAVDVCSAPGRMDGSAEPSQGSGEEAPGARQPSLPSAEGDGAGLSPCGVSQALDGQDGDPLEVHEEPLSGTEMEIFALFNKPKNHQKCRQYYPVTIPLRVSRNGQMVSSLDANWLEHMSDHFRKGGVLVNAVFYLGVVNDSLHGLTDGVFIFEAVSTEDSKTMQGYDAIVVEQWTVLEGVEVQTDYVPLLNSLAAYGWQLTCVLPTPVVKTTREGNVSTKQIVFLQRPCLPQKMKKKESKFQWRFSREDMHTRQMRKSKGKLSARDKRQAEENEKNLEDQFSRADDVGNCVLGLQQEDGAPEEMKVPIQEVTGEEPHPDSRLCVGGEVVQNGPASHCRAPEGGCCGQSGPDPGEDAREGGAEEVAAEPATAEDN